MKWGHHYEARPENRLLFWVFECILRPYNAPLDRWLKEIFLNAGGIGGDPGWSMDCVSLKNGTEAYQVWADPDISGIEPSEVIYSSDTVHQALRQSLIAFSEEYPERNQEVQMVLKKYRL